MHGLQSPQLACLKYLGGPLLSPSRSKGRHLARVFPNTVAPDIRMSTYNPLAENSPARWVLPYLAAAAVATAHAATAGGGAAGGCAVGAAAAAAVAAVATAGLVVLVRWRVAISLRACVTIQSAAIRREKPDIVVASSWGGAIALLCIQQGHWGGPTLLLAPALSLKGWWAKLLVQPLAWEGQQPETAAAVTQRLAAERCLVLQVLVTHSVLHSLTNAAASTCRGEPTPSWTPRPCNGGAGAPVCGASPSTAPQIVDCTDPLTVTDCSAAAAAAAAGASWSPARRTTCTTRWCGQGCSSRLWRAWPRARPPDRASGTVGRKWGVRAARLALARRVSLQQRPPASPEETKQPQRTGRRSPANRVAAEELQVHCVRHAQHWLAHAVRMHMRCACTCVRHGHVVQSCRRCSILPVCFPVVSGLTRAISSA